MAVHSSANPLHFCESLGSMRQQTYRAMRIFLYCDGPLSPPLDAAIERHLVCAPGQDVVLRNEKPKGLATGLNCLIDRALQDTSIRYLARMDSDDLSTPNRIASQVAFMESRPEVTVAGTWVIEFTTPGQSDFHKQLPSAPTEVAQFMLYRSPLAHPTVMFRRGVFERGHRYDPRRLIMQDYELWSRLLLAGE
ncbi:MAG: glycosyltransferase, partial [Rubrivivax sp.]|nr:glycosyltransferase [Rubrivivax sp.]